MWPFPQSSIIAVCVDDRHFPCAGILQVLGFHPKRCKVHCFVDRRRRSLHRPHCSPNLPLLVCCGSCYLCSAPNLMCSALTPGPAIQPSLVPRALVRHAAANLADAAADGGAPQPTPSNPIESAGGHDEFGQCACA
eukprot:EG_transcript_37588